MNKTLFKKAQLWNCQSVTISHPEQVCFQVSFERMRSVTPSKWVWKLIPQWCPTILFHALNFINLLILTDDQCIDIVASFKFLGITISWQGSWVECKMLMPLFIGKAHQRMYFLGRLKKVWPQKRHSHQILSLHYRNDTNFFNLFVVWWHVSTSKLLAGQGGQDHREDHRLQVAPSQVNLHNYRARGRSRTQKILSDVWNSAHHLF